MNHRDHARYLAADPGYAEWADEQDEQDRASQDFVMVKFDTWEAFQDALHNRDSSFRRQLRDHLGA